ncbi:SCO1 protein [Nadsonia fulvescens var. elongata DSM 6958]|uniref:SCO1 protein n=1 Tax=Nadsonia fulvescens var. elongata DSM 6958 TaxID=857566 RepID=A0A1E3PCY2_9ASCO|nr:SCO1 protein [Nadsonia fulvescens var. elongata DSM 6958]
MISKFLSRSSLRTSVFNSSRLQNVTRPFFLNRCSSRFLSTQPPKADGDKEAEPSTGTHGYDSTKPRKPLSRITIGKVSPGEMKRRQVTGFINWKAGIIFVLTGGGLWWFFTSEKGRLARESEAEANRGYGKPLIGGSFNLIDQDGKSFTDKDLLGKFSLVYFGFSLCPDICPDELEKMAVFIDDVNKDGEVMKPVFITCDPARDSPEVLKEYLSEFHPDIVGLTGEYDEIKNVCKKYRVYFSTPPNMKPGQDYLVDHSIFFYLMDPEGKFLDVLGRQYDNVTGPPRIKQMMSEWKPQAVRDAEEASKKKGFFSFLTKN